MSAKFDRLLRILNVLDQENTCTPSGLAGELEVTERSVFRYVNSLRDAGFPIVFDKERGTYAFQDGYKLKKVSLNVDETLALALARKLLGTLGRSFDCAFDSLEKKVIDTADPRQECVPSSVIVLNSRQRKTERDISDTLKMLTKVCVQHNLVQISYEALSSGELSEREIEPYYLFFSPDGFWNLRAYCRMRDGWRLFALDRIRDFKVLDRHFIPRIFAEDVGNEIAQGFGTYLDGDPVRVVVRFSPKIRPVIERKTWHASQENLPLENGWLESRFLTTGIEAVKFWLYRWMPHVRVVEPESLRREMLDELKVQMGHLEGGEGEAP